MGKLTVVPTDTGVPLTYCWMPATRQPPSTADAAPPELRNRFPFPKGSLSWRLPIVGISLRRGLRPLPRPPSAPPQIVRFVNLVAPEFKLSPDLVLAVMAAESNFDPLAVSPKNAQGLMQLMPDTAARFRVRPLTDPVQNIRGGMAYLRWLLAYFEGDLPLVLAAYNAGERAVERYRGVPPYLETRLYVGGIIAALGGQRTHAFDPAVAPPSDVLALLRATKRSR